MSRAQRRARGDFAPLVQVPEGMGDEPRVRLTQPTIDYVQGPPSGPNPYTCSDCGYITITIHAHPGVTPMFLACKACGERASSGMYPWVVIPVEAAGAPLWEWYRPSQVEYDTLPGPQRDHVDQGGLALRLREGSVPAPVRAETDSEKRHRVGRLFGGDPA